MNAKNIYLSLVSIRLFFRLYFLGDLGLNWKQAIFVSFISIRDFRAICLRVNSLFSMTGSSRIEQIRIYFNYNFVNWLMTLCPAYQYYRGYGCTQLHDKLHYSSLNWVSKTRVLYRVIIHLSHLPFPHPSSSFLSLSLYLCAVDVLPLINATRIRVPPGSVLSVWVEY